MGNTPGWYAYFSVALVSAHTLIFKSKEITPPPVLNLPPGMCGIYTGIFIFGRWVFRNLKYFLSIAYQACTLLDAWGSGTISARMIFCWYLILVTYHHWIISIVLVWCPCQASFLSFPLRFCLCLNTHICVAVSIVLLWRRTCLVHTWSYLDFWVFLLSFRVNPLVYSMESLRPSTPG